MTSFGMCGVEVLFVPNVPWLHRKVGTTELHISENEEQNHNLITANKSLKNVTRFK
jgi:hypothetical protein